MRVFGIEFRHDDLNKKKIIKTHSVSDIVDSFVPDEKFITKPLKALVPNQIYLNHKAKVSQLQNTSIPSSAPVRSNRRLRPNINRGSSRSAGFTSSEKDKTVEKKFDELLKTRAEGVRAHHVLVQNTEKNQTSIPRSIEKSKSTRSTPKSAQLIDINAKWQSMMTEDDEESKAKSRRIISFSEKVTCHKIPRIKDIIEEYDAFEREFLAECESRIADFNKDTEICYSNDSDDEEEVKRDNLELSFEMTIDDILETQVKIPASLSRQDEIFCESRIGKKQADDLGSVTSLAAACPTPERSLSPISFQQNETDLSSTADHLSELDSLFNSNVFDRAHQTVAVPVISLSMHMDSQTTLTLEACPPSRTSFWSSVFSKLSKILFNTASSKVKVHPI